MAEDEAGLVRSAAREKEQTKKNESSKSSGGAGGGGSTSSSSSAPAKGGKLSKKKPAHERSLTPSKEEKNQDKKASKPGPPSRRVGLCACKPCGKDSVEPDEIPCDICLDNDCPYAQEIINGPLSANAASSSDVTRDDRSSNAVHAGPTVAASSSTATLRLPREESAEVFTSVRHLLHFCTRRSAKWCSRLVRTLEDLDAPEQIFLHDLVEVGVLPLFNSKTFWGLPRVRFRTTSVLFTFLHVSP